MSSKRSAPRTWIEYVPDWRYAPMAYWVHIEQGVHWRDATTFLPPAPSPHGRSGYAVLHVEIGAHVLRFSSPAQLDEAIRVLGTTPLPNVRRMAEARQALVPTPPPTCRAAREDAAVVHGTNTHWLSRLPVAIKSAKSRLRVVEALRSVRASTVRDDRLFAPSPH